MDGNGYVALHRKLLTSGIFQNEKLLKVFIYCLLKASHSERDQTVGRQTVHLLPGQFIFGRKKAALELDMKESTVRDYINLLKEESSIDIKSTNKFSVVTVVNWEVYQSSNKNTDSNSAGISDSKMPSNGHQINTNNNVNNVENVKKDIQQGLGSGSLFWVNTYEMHYGIPSGTVIQRMNSFLDDGMENDVLIMAIEKAAENGQPFHYAAGIIKNWFSKNILTVDAAKAEEEEFKKRKVERLHGNRKPQANRPNPKYGTDRKNLDFSSSRNSL